MNYFDLAVQAKREKNFDLALEYYEKAGDGKGVSVNLLSSIAKIFYLQGKNPQAIAFHLAATHLALHIDLQKYNQGDQAIAHALEQLPDHIANQFPHPIGALLLYDRNTLRHLSHALLDHEGTFERTPEFRPYAALYYAQVLGDGSAKEVMQKYQIAGQDLLDFEEQHYTIHAFEILINKIQWDQLENSNVLYLYMNVGD